MLNLRLSHALALTIALAAPPLAAQTAITVGGLTVDQSEALEVTSEALSIDQESGKALFTGNVLISQGDMRLSANVVEVSYGTESGEITGLEATGGVTFVTESDAAEASAATYDPASGQLVLTGEVLLTQGPSAVSSDRMTIDTRTGAAQVSGNVRVRLVQEGEDG